MQTWDGEPVAAEKPHGAAVIVYRRTLDRIEYLILHRAFYGPDYEGDWAWSPPAGARHPGEAIDKCAERELFEETGLELALLPSSYGNENWAVFLAEASPMDAVLLEDEHDRYEWLNLDVAIQRCQPEPVALPLKKLAQATGHP